MKTLSAVLVLSTFLGLPFCHGQTKAPLRISVDREQKTKENVKQGNSRQDGNVIWHTPQVVDRSRDMALNIKIQNMGASEMTDLVVKYTVFGRDRQTRAIRPAGQGEKTITVKPLETKTVKTDPVNFESHDMTYNHGAFGNLNSQSGSEYYGIAVNVFVGSDKVATFLNPTTLDKQLEKLEKEQTGKSE